MAITETRALPAQFIEDLGKDYATQLTAATAAPLDTSKFAPSVAGQTALQQKATDLTTAGLGSYQPFLTGAGSTTQAAGAAQQGRFAQEGLGLAQTGLGIAGQELTGAGTALGTAGTTTAAAQPFISAAGTGLGQAGTTLGGVSPFINMAQAGLGMAGALTGTGTGTGLGSISSYMSPYQQQVIDTTMAEFDRQAAIRANQQAAAALGTPGAFGGGREGVQRAEYQAASDRNRAQTFANLQQQGFQNAAARRQQDLANQMGISNLQSGLGARAQDFSRAQISGLGTLGAQQQAQTQAVLDAQRQAAQMAIDEPRQALSRFGQGIAGITPGAGQIRIGEAPAAAGASPLMKALGLGLAGADIYGRIFT